MRWWAGLIPALYNYLIINRAQCHWYKNVKYARLRREQIYNNVNILFFNLSKINRFQIANKCLYEKWAENSEKTYLDLALILPPDSTNRYLVDFMSLNVLDWRRFDSPNKGLRSKTRAGKLWLE